MRHIFSLARIASAVALGALAVVMVCEIVMRLTIGRTWQLSPEFAGYLLAATTFLGVCGAYRDRQLMRIEVFYDRWPPHVRRKVSVIFEFVSLVAVATAGWYAFLFVQNGYLRGTKAPTLYSTPVWMPQSLIPIGLTLLTIAIALRLVRTFRGKEDV